MPGNAEIEWLDLEPLNPPPAPGAGGPRSGPRRPRWHWWYLVVAAALVAAILVATRPSHGKPGRAAHPSAPSPSSSSPSSPAVDAAAQAAAAAASRAAAEVAGTTSAGGSLLAVPADWILFGRGSAAVYELRLAAGQIVTTPVPVLSSSGAASFLAGPDRVVLISQNTPQAYEIPDGKPSQSLPAGFPQSGPAVPGPDPTHLWVPDPAGTSMALVGFDGTITGPEVPIPADAAAPVMSDGAGYMTFSGTGGVYDLRPSGITRITTGILLATGPTTWLTDECDTQYHCAPTVIDRATGARHTLSARVDDLAGGGLISPDGTTAAILENDNSVDQSLTLHLITLATGADRPTGIALQPNQIFQPGLFLWSPDNKWVFGTNATGRLFAVNVATDATTTLNVNLGPIGQLALRTEG